MGMQPPGDEWQSAPLTPTEIVSDLLYLIYRLVSPTLKHCLLPDLFSHHALHLFVVQSCLLPKNGSVKYL